MVSSMDKNYISNIQQKNFFFKIIEFTQPDGQQPSTSRAAAEKQDQDLAEPDSSKDGILYFVVISNSDNMKQNYNDES